MQIGSKEKWLLLGASSGLGAAFAERVRQKAELQLLSRRSLPAFDFSEEKQWPQILEFAKKFEPTRLFYFAGGGTWGPFSEKKWTSHLWTYRVNLLFPAYLMANFPWPNLQQATFVGSAIAEANPDPLAASYASAKHGLCGLITSLQAEKSLKSLDLRLFSPGYLDTPLLPPHAWPRQTPGLVQAPQQAAETLDQWIQDVRSANGHLILG